MSTLEKAIRIAARAHEGVKDKQGQPYILHPMRVMLGCDDPDAQIVAVLHDVVEDTDVTHDDIKKDGFSEAILAALRLVTHSRRDSYTDYILRCKADPLARAVKLADLHDNARLSRIMLRPEQLDRDLSRVKKYLLSYRFLCDEISEADFRKAMKSSD
jgi:(p)ppGpp synthase/HD superfamily hydrolase